jgi:hypothetical protein
MIERLDHNYLTSLFQFPTNGRQKSKRMVHTLLLFDDRPIKPISCGAPVFRQYTPRREEGAQDYMIGSRQGPKLTKLLGHKAGECLRERRAAIGWRSQGGIDI